MLKYISLLLLIITSSAAIAQSDTLTPRQEQVRKVLAMNIDDYKAYRAAMQQFGQRLAAIRQDSHLADSLKAKGIAQVHAEVKVWREAHLSSEQLAHLQEFELNNPRPSAASHGHSLKELKARMRKNQAPQLSNGNNQ